MARHSRKHKLSKKEQKAATKQESVASTQEADLSAVRRRTPVSVALPSTITVAALAKISTRTPAEIVQALLGNGLIATVNDSIDRETVEIIADELDLDISEVGAVETTATAKETNVVKSPRPPVVVVLGHVDHGKTTLLDAIRQANVVAGESGGITQHIGAYQVDVNQGKTKESVPRKITFIDTPGHEAFSAMRAHGVTMTDIAILVVAADDGVKPQTKEAASHAKAANVPLIVAINKIDVPGANVDRVKGELAEIGLAAEDWGGKTPTVMVSAKQQQGIDDLLDTVLLVADLEDLVARPTGSATGVVIEAHMQQGIGPVATILIQEGCLRVGDPVVIGNTWGKVRLMTDDRGVPHAVAGPADSVRVAGLRSVPTFGAALTVAGSEKEAREQSAAVVPRKSRLVSNSGDDEDETPTLTVVLKADVDGSIAAIASSLEAIQPEGVRILIVHTGVGDLSESDVNLALASEHPFLVAFRTGATVAARNLARTRSLTIQAYDIIYRLIDDVTLAAKQLREPVTQSVEVGRLKVLQVFHTTKTAQIIGGRVEDGAVPKGGILEIHRGTETIGTGVIESLQRGQQKADRVATGEECGMGVATTETILEGDVLVVSTVSTS